MKNSKLYLLMFLFTSISLSSQTITEADFILPIGPFTVHMSAYQSSYAGEGMTWDYSNLVVDSSYVMEFASPEITPQGDNFPSANAVEIRSGDYPGNQYTYYELNANGLYDQGFATDSEFTVYYNFDDEADPWAVLEFPFAYDSAWSDVNADPWMWSGYSEYTSIDGFGTLEMPYGSVNNVLRVNTYGHVVTWWSDYGFTRTISYYKPGIGWPILVTTFSGHTSVDFGGSGTLKWIDINDLTGVEESGLQAIGIDLFPNPSSGNTQVVFGAQGAISIEVIDGAGRLVSIEQLGTLAPGFHKHALDVSALPAGVYTVHIQNDNNEQGIKRLLVE